MILKHMKKNSVFMASGAWDLLTVTGLACAIILGGEFFFFLNNGLGIETQEWILYLLMGTAFPVCVVLLMISKRNSSIHIIVKKIESLFVCLSFVFLGIVITRYLLVSSFTEFAFAFIATLIQTIIIFAFIRQNHKFFTTKDALIGLLLIVWGIAIWMIATRLITHRYGRLDNPYTIEWWFWPGWPGNFSGVLQGSFIRRSFLLVVILIVVTRYFFYSTKLANFKSPVFTPLEKRRTVLIVFDIGAVVLLSLLCINTDRMLNPDIQAHIDFLLGPVVAVKQGAWLLWDQPSQYGFLWVFIVAILPIKNVAIALSAFLWFLNFSLSVLIYKVITYYESNSIIWRLLAFLLVTSSFLIRSFPNQDLNLGILNGDFTDAYIMWYWLSPVDIPQSSAIRTIWCCVLLVIASQRFFSANASFEKNSILGCSVWVIGCLWSAESAVYSTATWIPAYIFFAVTENKIKWLLLPFCFLSITVLVISGYYYVQLGRLPEWFALFEFVSTVGPSGNWNVPMPRNGVIWIALLLLICVVSLTLNYAKHSFHDIRIGVSLACFGAIWSVTSYYIGDSHNSKFHVLIHVYILSAITIMKMIQNKVKYDVLSHYFHRLTLSVFVIVVLVCGLDFDKHSFQLFVDSQINRAYKPFSLAHYRAPVPHTLSDLFLKAKIEPISKVMLANSFSNLGAWHYSELEYFYNYEVWLPTTPAINYDRKKAYITRFVSRLCSGGWLVYPAPHRSFQDTENNKLNYQVQENLISSMDYFQKTLTYSNSDWILDYYELKPNNVPMCVGK